MPINTNEPEYKTVPEVDHKTAPVQPLSAPPSSRKPKKRGLIWVLFLLIVAGVAGYAVWRASHPAPVTGGAGGGRRGGGAGGQGGPVPVVVSKVARSSIPVYLNGLGNVTAFYTVTVKSRV